MRAIGVVTVLLGACAVIAADGPARADELPLLARPIGIGGGGGHGGHGGGAEGIFLGVDGGLGIVGSFQGAPAQYAGAVGARVGWQSPRGLSVFGGYDYLGVTPKGADGALQTFTFGVRYAFPPLVPAPYVEALVGGAFASQWSTRPTGGIGIGITAPIGPVSFDLGGRDLVMSDQGSLYQAFTLEGGVSLTF